MNKETLEEAAKRMLLQTVVDGNNSFDLDRDLRIKEDVIKAMISIAKWQQEQDNNKYSEDEVLELLIKSEEFTSKYSSRTNLTTWFKQFKKK